LSLATAQPASPTEVTAIGRVGAVLQARVGSRLSGQVTAWTHTGDQRPLDAGMPVKQGQELFRVDPTTYESRVNVAKAALAQAQAVLANLKAGVREERRQELRATLAGIDARIAEQKRDEERFRRLVEQDKTVPVKRLEEVQLQLALLQEDKRCAQARLAEAEAGPTPTEIAVAEAAVVHARALLGAAELDLRDTVVKAPFDGIITQRFKSFGDYLNNAPFTEVLEIVSEDRLEAEFRLPETYFLQVAAGKTLVSLQTPLLPEGLKLPVTRLIETIDMQSGTFAFRVCIPSGQNGRLRPGAFLQGTVLLDSARESAIVPQRAVVQAEGKAFVFVAQNGKMSRRAVVVGDALTEAVIVKSGVKPGETLVVGPSGQLEDGAALPSYLAPR